MYLSDNEIITFFQIFHDLILGPADRGFLKNISLFVNAVNS